MMCSALFSCGVSFLTNRKGAEGSLHTLDKTGKAHQSSAKTWSCPPSFQCPQTALAYNRDWVFWRCPWHQFCSIVGAHNNNTALGDFLENAVIHASKVSKESL